MACGNRFHRGMGEAVSTVAGLTTGTNEYSRPNLVLVDLVLTAWED